jgi:hypothetical protein
MRASASANTMSLARTSAPRSVDGILLLYHRPLAAGARTVLDHVDAFRRHSRYGVWPVNTELGFPSGLDGLRFSAIVLHYSLFGTAEYPLGDRFVAYLDGDGRTAYKVAFFQDEHRFCRQRFAFINDRGIDCVYTCLEPRERDRVYRSHTKVREMRTTLPGLVSEGLVAAGERYARPDAERPVDISYRGRPLEAYMGRAAREKYDIGIEFKRRAADSGLVLDIECEESARIYGEDWYRFVAASRSTLGTESGVSVFDVDGEVYDAYQQLRKQPGPEREERFRAAIARWEDRIYYRTISPRQFEAAALGTCQILYAGRYSDVMAPMVHYLPLEKDFSNFDEIVALHRDPEVRRELTANAKRDLIDSGTYSYATLVRGLDEHLDAQGLTARVADDRRAEVDAALARGRAAREARARVGHLRATLRGADWPGRPLARRIYRRVRPLGGSA